MIRHIVKIIASFCLLIVFSAGLLSSSAQALEIRQLTSPKGIKLWFVKDTNLPVIQMRFLWRGGAANFDPGLIRFLSTMLDEGAGDLDAKTFQTRKEDYGIKLSFSAENDNFSGSLRTLTKHKDEAFSLLGLAVNNPRFDVAPLERMRQALMAGHRSSASNSGTIASETWWQNALEGHAYATPMRGTPEATQKINSSMLRKAHQQLFAQDNLIISVVGDIEEADLLSQVDEIFAELPLKNTLQPIKPFTFSDEKVVLVEFPGPQTEIIFGHIGIPFDDPDYYTAIVVNHILGGGGFSARLMTEIREKRGLVYSVYSYMDEVGSLPVWMGRMATGHTNVDEALSILRTELQHMLKDGPTEIELENAKNYIIGSYALGFDSGRKIASKMLTAQFFDLPPSHFEKRNNYIKAVTLEDAKRVARRLLKPDQLIITAVGQKNTSE